MRTRHAAAMVLLPIISACGGGSDETGTPGPLAFSVVDSSAYGSHGNIRVARFTTTKTASEWNALWAEYKGADARPAPKVDFQSQMVVGVFAGERAAGCTHAEIGRVVRGDNAVSVEYSESVSPAVASGRLACGAAFAYPAVLAAIPRTDLPVTFVRVEPAPRAPLPAMAAPQPIYVENSYFVTFKPSTASYTSPVWPADPARPRGFNNGVPFPEHGTGQSKGALAVELGIRGDVVHILDAMNAATLSIDAADAERLRRDPRVLRVEQDMLGFGG